MSGIALGATAAVVGGAEFFSGLESHKKDERELKSLTQPFYKIQDEYYQNRNLAASQAGQGTPTATKQFQTQENQRGLTAGLQDILKAGGDVNDASMLLSQYNNNLSREAGADAEQHLANIQYFMNANKDLAGQKTTQWSVNEYQPYEAKLKELKQAAATDQQNEWNGITTAAGGVTAGITGNQNASLIKKLMQKSTPQDPYASGTNFAPRSVLPGVQQSGATAGSPAGDYGTLDPNSYSASALATLPDQSQDF